MKLTIGMATYNDNFGVFMTLEALRMYHDLSDCEILVVDNKGDDWLYKWVTNWHGGVARYERYTEIGGTTQPREQVFQLAKGAWGLCIDSHVLLARDAIMHLKNWITKNPMSDDLIHGPLTYDSLDVYSTHMEPVWRANMWGIWSDVVHEEELPKTPFEIPMHGLGIFGARRESWLGFNPHFRGFGGEEGYIHEKYRQAGRKVLCLPFLKWVHRFSETGTGYSLDMVDRVTNYLIGHEELGLDTEPIREHFGSQLFNRAMEKAVDALPPKKILLVGNGPSAIQGNMGETIDQFPGEIARFNNYRTAGLEKQVGSRTDHWITCSGFTPEKQHHPHRLFINWQFDEQRTKDEERLKTKCDRFTRVPKDTMLATTAAMNHGHPTTGAIAVTHFLNRGYEIYIHGFDFLDPSKAHHYHDDKQVPGPNHSPAAEKVFFGALLAERKIRWIEKN